MSEKGPFRCQKKALLSQHVFGHGEMWLAVWAVGKVIKRAPVGTIKRGSFLTEGNVLTHFSCIVSLRSSEFLCVPVEIESFLF